MAQARLETLTLKTLADSTRAATHAVAAARAGSSRLLAVVDQRVTQVAADRLEPHARRVAGHLRSYGSLAHDRALQGVNTLGERADAGLKWSAKSVAAQVKRMAKMADGVQNPVLAKGLSTAARVSMPGARLAQVVSERVAETTASWPKAVAGKAVKVSRRRVGATRTTARRSALATIQAEATEASQTATGTARRAVKATSRKASAVSRKATATTGKAATATGKAATTTARKVSTRASDSVKAAKAAAEA